jgi:hypothetical protein
VTPFSLVNRDVSGVAVWQRRRCPSSGRQRWNTVELGYSVTKGTVYFVSLWTSVVTTEGCNVTVNCEELIGITENVTLYTRWRLHRCRYNRVRLYIVTFRTYWHTNVASFCSEQQRPIRQHVSSEALLVGSWCCTWPVVTELLSTDRGAFPTQAQMSRAVRLVTEATRVGTGM